MQSDKNSQIVIYSEVTKLCNNNCSFCCIDLAKRNGSFIKKEVRERVLQFMSYFSTINFKIFFHLIGEPLFYAGLEEYIKLSLLPNTEPWICTNGILLTKERLLKLYSAGLQNIWFSMFYTNETDYKRYVNSNTYFKVKENLNTLISHSGLFRKIQIITFSDDISDLIERIKYKDNIFIQKSRNIYKWRIIGRMPLFLKLFNTFQKNYNKKYICISLDGDVCFDWRDYNFKNSIGNICDLDNETIMNSCFNINS